LNSKKTTWDDLDSSLRNKSEDSAPAPGVRRGRGRCTVGLRGNGDRQCQSTFR
jgi:hypothetical protein